MNGSNSSNVQVRQQVAYVIAVIAKCPIAGQSKTRLQPLFTRSNAHCTNDDGASIVAKAMLRDVLVSISHCCHQARNDNETSNNSNKSNDTEIIIDQFLFYAPPNQEGYEMMQHIVDSCHDKSTGSRSSRCIAEDWTLFPVDNSPPNSTKENEVIDGDYESHSNNLSNILSNAVRTGQTRYATIPTTVILLGMDAPEIPMLELYNIITTPSLSLSSPLSQEPSVTLPLPPPITTTPSAFLCPAYDGGYVLLSIPPLVHPETIQTIFQSVSPYWSHPLTAITQIKALSDVGIPTIVGPIVHDIDTPDDVLELIQRLKSYTRTQSYDTRVTAVEVNTGTNMEIETCTLYRPSVLRTATTTTTPSPTSIFPNYVPCPYVRQALMDLQLF
jgi:glycosyltransferase A (GT-A) superfamily protein (DUF2064 family)